MDFLSYFHTSTPVGETSVSLYTCGVISGRSAVLESVCLKLVGHSSVDLFSCFTLTVYASLVCLYFVYY